MCNKHRVLYSSLRTVLRCWLDLVPRSVLTPPFDYAACGLLRPTAQHKLARRCSCRCRAVDATICGRWNADRRCRACAAKFLEYLQVDYLLYEGTAQTDTGCQTSVQRAATSGGGVVPYRCCRNLLA